MKLIDLLVQELPKRDGWPDGAACAVQDLTKQICFSSAMEGIQFRNEMWRDGKWQGAWLNSYVDELAEDYATAIINREQYEAALSAAQQPVWDGEGLPPVGCECEAIYGRDAWFKVKIIAHDSGRVIGRWLEGDRNDDLLDYSHQESFRPIRSEADKKRAEGVIALSRVDPSVAPFEYGAKHSDGSLIGPFWYELYDAIAAGKIPHIRIE
ncbi:hypothetical protein R2281_003883 [Cronobacter dublinensis]|nr:hypothetical protein [Cronobacter dublinensis]